MGVKIVLNHKVEDLLAEQQAGGFDAVFVAVGAHLSKRIDIPARDAGKMLDAVSFLREVDAGRRRNWVAAWRSTAAATPPWTRRASPSAWAPTRR